jgi:formate-dependent nitrite reductase membrane component NrfD
MEKFEFAGLEINKVSIFSLLFNKTMIVAYLFLIIAFVGIFEVFEMRWFSDVISVHSIALDPTNPDTIEAMKQAIFGHIGEVSRENPWTLFIANYMYMIYTGSGIIFLVALGEVMGINVIAKTAAGFMVAGLALVFAGLFTIVTDLNFINILSMFTSPNFTAGMWLMVPLYSVYIPFVLVEIYLLVTNKRELAKKFAYILLVAGLGIDVIEFYIQGLLFSLSAPRALWTDTPVLALYFIISAFVSSLGVMGIFSYLVHKSRKEYQELMLLIRKALFVFIPMLIIYEIVIYSVVSPEWTAQIIAGPFKYIYFVGYVFLGMLLPLALVAKSTKSSMILLASVFAVIGGFVGRWIFVYGGNLEPMTNRFGTGYERYDVYGVTDLFNYATPHLGEILIVVGSLGVSILVYSLVDSLLSVGKIRDHH